MLKIFLWLLLVAVAVFALDRLLLYMEKRGWIYYRKKKPSSSALSNACLEIQQLLEPSKKYVVEIKKDEKKQQAEAGDLPPGLEEEKPEVEE
ncbi:MAG TPA: hypothetical protein PLB50_04570 [Candidatus Saccharicenans sp.]|jgi:hypothetical protein|nr:hypothetical protein [Candidatus Saccharicenans sp.]HNT00674.1 hypothetical protein [Candidatus Saccharicenans sp.]HPB60006.1 hypothetical protein [Candidatus Saccharicenans sp.]HQO75934.1 hypothetical protein [Candidatus Saccharicenans sp.]HUM79614.1 hypothetical protein [Candidatus Saccharicenans sp.]